MLKTINGGKQPTKATKYSAGIDLYANEDVMIGAGKTVMVGLGVCIDLKYLLKNLEKEIDFKHKCGTILVGEAKEEYCKKKNEVENKFETFCRTHYLELHPRSSLRAKGIIANTGIIDLDYKDEIKIIIHNPLSLSGFGIDKNDGIHLPEKMPYYEIKKCDKIAQILLKEHKGILFGIESNEERKGGFGSTNKDNR